MKIDVLQFDLLAGLPRDSCRCPIALALKRAFPGKTVAVSREEILLDDKTFNVSKAVAEFIMDFDATKTRMRNGTNSNPFRSSCRWKHDLFRRAATVPRRGAAVGSAESPW